MDSPKITYKYYSNPAFCAQSEVVYTQQTPCVSARITTSPNSKGPHPGAVRVPPLGANSPRSLFGQLELGNHRVKTDISDNPLRIKPESPLQYPPPPKLPPKPGPKPEITQNRFGSMRVIQKTPVKLQKRSQSMRTKALKFKTQDLELYQVNNNNVVASETDSNAEEETEITVQNARVVSHRYAEIPDEEIDDFSPSKKRIVDNEPDEYNVDAPSENEYKEVPTEIVRTVNGKVHRYAIIPSEEEEEVEIEENTIVYQEQTKVVAYQRAESPPTFYLKSPGMSRKNHEATQKLHELLSTPKKQIRRSSLKSCASSPSLRTQMNASGRTFSPERRNGFPVTPSKRMTTSTPKQQPITPSKSCVNLTSPPLPRRNPNMTSPISPKAQQKLSYETSVNLSPERRNPGYADHNRSFDMDRSREFDRMKMFERKSTPMSKTTAVISPRMAGSGGSSSGGSVFSGKKFKATPGCATLALAAAMMALCGGLGASLSLYIMYTFGKKYYLNFGVISGFTCFILGILGFRSSSYKMLPNRNYVSGYALLSVFSFFSCAALFVILVKGGVKGPLEDAIGGAVSCLGALCPLLAFVGALASCCCSRTPPDNRVADI